MPKKGYKQTKAHKLNIGKSKKGHPNYFFKHTAFAIKKIRDAQIGENNYQWKGEKAAYSSKHHWINKKLGKATKCSLCPKTGTGCQIHWANIDHKYRRVEQDWFQACVKCHNEYDRQNNLRDNLIQLNTKQP